MSRTSDIEQQLAHMRWRRMQNERAIRGSLDMSKQLTVRDQLLHNGTDNIEIKNKWLSDAISDELSRPLVLSDGEMRKLENDDIITKNKLIKGSDRQLKALGSLKGMLTSRIKNDYGGKAVQIDKLAKLDMIEKKIKQNKKSIENTQALFPKKEWGTFKV